MANPFQPRPPFEPRVIYPSSLGSSALTQRAVETPAMSQQPSRCTVREATGGDGSRTFKDCGGQEVSKIEWQNGRIVSTGDEEIEGGCDDSSST